MSQRMARRLGFSLAGLSWLLLAVPLAAQPAGLPLDLKPLRKLVGKRVGVYLHDARVHRGELVEVREDYLLVKTDPTSSPDKKAVYYRREKIALAEIARVEEEGSVVGQRPGARLSEDWNILRLFRVGDRIEVKTRDKKSHSGRFVAYSEEAISLREANREVGYRREEVLRVRLVIPGEPGKVALKGFLIGLVPAGFSTLIGALYCVEYYEDLYLPGEPTKCVARTAMISVGIFGGGGAAIGALLERPTKTVIYEPPPAGAVPAGPMPQAPSFTPASDLGSLPAPLRDVYRVFSAEQAAREIARALAHEFGTRDSWPAVR